ncbi:MAG: response regulator [Chloroflexi bacterium]|nr:response regulator [Chloroflexota bacterium]MDA1218603.1 response regulator [Chloroflexota bacterium]
MTKILVVEDDQDIRDLLVDSLSDLGYDVVEAADGGAGYQCALEEHPDIILLDVMMPVMDGFEVLQKLKINPATNSVPVIMVSAKGQELDINTATDAGAWSYIVKPWDPEDLESKIMGAEAEAQKAA